MDALERAVISQLGYDPDDYDEEELKGTLGDVRRGGADGGFGGFTNYTETVDFFNKHKRLIVKLVKEQAKELGAGSAVGMVSRFKYLRGEVDYDEIAEALYSPPNDSDAYTIIANSLAWFALEYVAWEKE